MSEIRMVAMTSEQFAEIERHILELMRAKKNERAAVMMNLSLSWKFAKPEAAPQPENVIPFPDQFSRKVKEVPT